MSADEIIRAQNMLNDLRRVTGSLRSRHGDSLSMRRLLVDLDRVDIGLEELRTAGYARQRAGIVVVPDTPYDATMWHGADDEGLGGWRDQDSA